MKLRSYPAAWRPTGTYTELVGRELLVDVIRPLDDTKIDHDEVGPMFRVRSQHNGHEYDAFHDELTCLHDGEEDARDCFLAPR